MTKLISEVFNNIDSAEQAYQLTINMGYLPEEINLFMSEKTRHQYHSKVPIMSVENDNTAKSVIKGSVVGGAIGATFGILTLMATSVMVPGAGIIISGPILGGLASMGAGAVGGGLVGLLSSVGITQEEAAKYEEEIQNGSIMIAVIAKTEDVQALQAKWHSIRYQALHA